MILLVSCTQRRMYQSSRRKLRSSPNSVSSKLTKLSQLKREQFHSNTRFKDKQSKLEERKLKFLEKELDIKMEALQVEVEHKHMQFKADLLCQHLQLLKEGVSQEDIDNLLPINDSSNMYAKTLLRLVSPPLCSTD